MELLSKVQVVRDSIATITQILADKDIPVRQEGLKAYVAFNERTGEPVKVCLPYLPDDASDELIMAVQGFLDHEVGHLLFTDRKALLEIAHDEQLLEMQNIFEDPYVERKMRGRFPGSRDNLNRLYEFFIDKVVDKNYRKLIEMGEVNPMAYFGTLFPCISRAWAEFPEFEKYMEDKWDLVEPIVKKIDPALIARVPTSNSTRENIEIGREVLLQIMSVSDDDFGDDRHYEDEGEESMPSKSGGASGGASGGTGSSSGRTRGGRGLVDEEGDEEEKETRETSDMDDTDDHLEEDDSETESEGDSDDESDDESGSSSKSGKDEDAKSDKSGKSEGSSKVSGEDEDEDESEDDEESGAGGEGDDEEEEGADLETGSKIGGEGKESDSVDESEAGEDEAKGDGVGKESKDSTWEPEDGDDFLKHSKGDIDSAISDSISDLAVESARRSEYVIPTTDHDLIEPAPLACSPEAAARRVPDLDAKVANVASVIQADFEQAFVSQQKSYWRGSQLRGRINPSQLSRLRTGDMRVFRKKQMHKTQDYDVQLVIDCSGSMYGSRISLAIQAAYAMGVALNRIGINFEIIGFTSRSGVRLGSSEISGVSYARRDAIWMPIFKDFKEQWSPQVMQRLASWLDSRDLAENVDGESIMYAAKRLAAQPSPGKAMIVLSDGSPCCASDDRMALRRHLRNTTQTIQNAGINLVGIGIQHEGVKEFFDEYSVLHNLEDLPGEVISKVREIIL